MSEYSSGVPTNENGNTNNSKIYSGRFPFNLYVDGTEIPMDALIEYEILEKLYQVIDAHFDAYKPDSVLEYQIELTDGYSIDYTSSAPMGDFRLPPLEKVIEGKKYTVEFGRIRTNNESNAGFSNFANNSPVRNRKNNRDKAGAEASLSDFAEGSLGLAPESVPSLKANNGNVQRANYSRNTSGIPDEEDELAMEEVVAPVAAPVNAAPFNNDGFTRKPRAPKTARAPVAAPVNATPFNNDGFTRKPRAPKTAVAPVAAPVRSPKAAKTRKTPAHIAIQGEVRKELKALATQKGYPANVKAPVAIVAPLAKLRSTNAGLYRQKMEQYINALIGGEKLKSLGIPKSKDTMRKKAAKAAQAAQPQPLENAMGAQPPPLENAAPRSTGDLVFALKNSFREVLGHEAPPAFVRKYVATIKNTEKRGRITPEMFVDVCAAFGQKRTRKVHPKRSGSRKSRSRSTRSRSR
jgi:hypothetical protein